MKAARRQL